MKECTIVVIVNKKAQYEMFLSSLKQQKNVEYQLITIENYDNCCAGARQTFNSIMSAVKFEKVIFCHQDIVFENENVLEKILDEVEKLNNIGVVGIAGCREGKRWEIISNLRHGDERKHCGRRISNPVEVQSVDECFFVMEKEFCEKIRFTEIEGWHLYAVEQCLRAKEYGKKNYVIPSEIWHQSDGKSLDPQYVLMLLKLKNKYALNKDILNTTVKQWDFTNFKGRVYIKYYYIKQVLKKILKK